MPIESEHLQTGVVDHLSALTLVNTHAHMGMMEGQQERVSASPWVELERVSASPWVELESVWVLPWVELERLEIEWDSPGVRLEIEWV